MDYLSYLNQERDSIVNIENILSIDIVNVSEINGRGNNGQFGLHDIIVYYYDEYTQDKEGKTIGRYSSHYNALYVLRSIIDNIDENESCVFVMPTENENKELNYRFYRSTNGNIEEKVSQEENLEEE